MRNKVYLGLGTNLGDKLANLQNALVKLKEAGSLLKTSSIYETEAWGNENQDSFFNLVCELNTTFSSRELLHKCLEIEKKLGRVRKEKWGERLIDIDILFFNNEIITEENLIIPHPFIQERNFVLEPLNEIASDFIHPKYNQTISELAKISTDRLNVKHLDLQI